jgi:hypothetical protein
MVCSRAAPIRAATAQWLVTERGLDRCQSFTAKFAKDAEDENSFTAKNAKAAKDQA